MIETRLTKRRTVDVTNYTTVVNIDMTNCSWNRVEMMYTCYQYRDDKLYNRGCTLVTDKHLTNCTIMDETDVQLFGA